MATLVINSVNWMIGKSIRMSALVRPLTFAFFAVIASGVVAAAEPERLSLICTGKYQSFDGDTSIYDIPNSPFEVDFQARKVIPITPGYKSEGYELVSYDQYYIQFYAPYRSDNKIIGRITGTINRMNGELTITGVKGAEVDYRIDHKCRKATQQF